MTPEPKTEPEADTLPPAGWQNWQPPPGLPEPARQAWLAGLGALARAQAEGGKALETLTRQGLALQTQATQIAQERLSGIFEDRVARALASLGLPSAQDWAALQARVQALETALQSAPQAVPRDTPNAGQPSTATRRPASAARPAPSATARRAAPEPQARAGVKPRPSGKKPRTPASP